MQDVLDLLGAGGGCGEEAAPAALVLAVGAVEAQGVEVEIGSKVGGEWLDHRHRAAARVAQAGAAGW
ncbi:MAG TPA: hypothetical protein RMH99_27320 [Sandaracinaceae bacterium LLY-WYZ-13_1]|nr:hypothetical protein [Sandaracinaceae bacterium LLY-WYZ-13_1]